MTDDAAAFVVREACALSGRCPAELTAKADPVMHYSLRRTVEWSILLKMMYKMVPGSPPLGSHEYPTLYAAKEAAERFVSFPSEESTALRDRLKSLLASDPERAADARSIDLVDGIGKFAYQEIHDLGHDDGKDTCLTCEGQKHIECPECGGTGKIVQRDVFAGENDQNFQYIDCPTCDGKTVVACGDCGGTGIVTRSDHENQKVITHLYLFKATATPKLSASIADSETSPALSKAVSNYVVLDRNREILLKHGSLQKSECCTQSSLWTVSFQETFAVPMALVDLRYAGNRYDIAVLANPMAVLDWGEAIEPMLIYKPISNPVNLLAAGRLKLHRDLFTSALRNQTERNRILCGVANAVSREYIHDALKGYAALIVKHTSRCKERARSATAVVFASILFGTYFLATDQAAILNRLPLFGMGHSVSHHPLVSAVIVAVLGSYIVYRAYYLLSRRAWCVKYLGKDVYQAVVVAERKMFLERVRATRGVRSTNRVDPGRRRPQASRRIDDRRQHPTRHPAMRIEFAEGGEYTRPPTSAKDAAPPWQ